MEKNEFVRRKKKQDANIRYKRNNRLWYKAHNKLWRATGKGRILKPSICSVCGSAGFIEGHIPDFSNPLAVVWLCARGFAHKVVGLCAELKFAHKLLF
ncbi:MAG: hypothetical protein JSW06_04280 [Thermoplasmatales archaeon]|nr:MAG: hypothetical protein JSW06_04280 [Thermoplasmatales archaeon]